MDLKSIAEAYQSIQEGKVNAGLQAYLDKKKGKKENGEEKEEENGKESKGSKPDFLDLDKDGDKKEPMKKAAKEKKMKEEAVIEHHQKDADGKVIEHEDTTPSSVEEKTVLEQLAENGREIDAFEAVISYLIDEGFAKSWEEAQDIMITLKPELVEEVYQSQLKKLEEGAGEALGAAVGGPVGAGIVGGVTGKDSKIKKAAGAAGGAVLGKIVGKGVAAAIPVPIPGKMAIGGKIGQAAGAYVGAKVGK